MKAFNLRMSKTMYQSLATVIAPFILILIGFLYRMYEENMPLWMKTVPVLSGIITLGYLFLICIIKSCEEDL